MIIDKDKEQDAIIKILEDQSNNAINRSIAGIIYVVASQRYIGATWEEIESFLEHILNVRLDAEIISRQLNLLIDNNIITYDKERDLYFLSKKYKNMQLKEIFEDTEIKILLKANVI
ncbi:MAG: hypothetical protein ARM1_0384 [Candidatus Micrarchaeota archaeon]|nr:MAG: hypothetical protein ARM1_0384 [Candidatus Micrarchaeota archaeon]